jgi:catechol 2,3-dioxygenase-like lactoylglutathione lyase family enzyme
MIADDQQPEVWVGHIDMETDQLEASEAFMIALGMRPLFKTDDIAILELRAATHLVLIREDSVEPGEAKFDLMVDDLNAYHGRLTEAGIAPSDIEEGRIHNRFTVRDPSGHSITVNSSHSSGLTV